MSVTYRMLPVVTPAGTNPSHLTTTVNGRSYTAVAGTTADVPDFDASELEANGWMKVSGPLSVGSGTTANRPTTMPDGRAIPARSTYLDTTLEYIVVYDGATWRNPSSGASV